MSLCGELSCEDTFNVLMASAGGATSGSFVLLSCRS